MGPDAVEARLGGYSGPGLSKVTLLDGIRERAGTVRYADGCGRQDGVGEGAITEAVRLARASGLAVVAAGIEEGEARDRSDIRLPGRQAELIRRVAATGTPTVVVLYGGSAVDMSEWIEAADAVLMAWYPGEEGGRAVADVLWGDADPGGAPAHHVPAGRRPAAARLQPQADGAVRRLPRPPGRAALPVRIRAELHRVRVLRPGDRSGGDRYRRDGPGVMHGHERRVAGGRRGRRALYPRHPGLGRPAGHRAQGLPQGLPGAGRVRPR
ncbi:MAG: glycoside hydrolase family 3 C-terminal domain-containing protein [Candidatus Moduliflexus flocculans]|nr:glycoside hydrolase family 3 C-terminal domain-containing protein [Candidatus Moduliflexus flocculans]